MQRLSEVDLKSHIGKEPITIKFLIINKELKKNSNNTYHLALDVQDGNNKAFIRF